MNSERKIAALGGAPAFQSPLHVAQVNLPAWEKVEEMFKGVFGRHYFANHGPLVTELDRVLSETLQVEHAISVTNGTMALMLLARSLDLPGEVIVPSFTFPATIQALTWAGLDPVFCDIDSESHTITAELVEQKITNRTVAVMGVHLWGRACEPESLTMLCENYGLKLIFDAAHGIGCKHKGRFFGGFGSGEAFSFHATKVLNGAEGGCITTNDADLADRLMTMRNFHPSETYTNVPLRFNAKMSEAQAAMTLLSLKELKYNIAANKGRYQAYMKGLAEIPGLSCIEYIEENNYQYIVVEVDDEIFGLSRDDLVDALKLENILCRKHFYPGVHNWPKYKLESLFLGNTEVLCKKIMQLPNGQAMSINDVNKICKTIFEIRDSREFVELKDEFIR